MRTLRLSLIALGVLYAALCWGQMPRLAEPTAAYAYPAGAKQGTLTHVIVGGQSLAGVRAVHVTGDGVRAVSVDYGRALNKAVLRDVGQYLRLYMRKRWNEAMGRPPEMEKDPGEAEDLDPLPDHPWLRDLDKKSLKELDELRMRLFNPKAQPNAQLGEMAYLDVTVDPKAAPGRRELRLETPMGLSNPVSFVVGSLPEVAEKEPNAPDTPAPAVDTPVVLNGQIMPGDVDVFRLKARRGQKLVITTQARSLTPYLADAVPGWFQAMLALRDAQGKQVAFADDYRFDPDPVLCYQVPQEGEYALEIRDSIYRGREDFVYRLTIGEQPFVTSVFPLGGTAGQPLTAQLTGWNLPSATAQLDTMPNGPEIRQTSWQWANGRSNTVSYAVDGLPPVTEAEPNDETPQKVAFPQAISGRVSKPGDVDAFRFEGQAGQEIVAEVQARRLGSPLDSLLRLLDASGHVVALNDDSDDGLSALQTHHADSQLRVKLPKAGAYTVTVSDAQRHGGEDFAYRLCLRAPHPDFVVKVTPSSLKLAAGRTVELTAHVLRQDGFDGPVELVLGGLANGFVLSGGHVPAGAGSVHCTLTAPDKPLTGPVALQVVGKAELGGAPVTRVAVAAEDMMQAFAYRQLVPAEQLVTLVVQSPRWAPALSIANGSPLRLPAGGTAQVQITAPPLPSMLKALHLELQSAPDGVTVKEQTVTPTGLTLVVQSDRAKVKPGPADNLIVAVFYETEMKRGNGKTTSVRAPVGVLPAVRVEIVP